MEFAVIDHLDAASSRPLSPEGIGRLSEVANDVHDPARRITKKVSGESWAV